MLTFGAAPEIQFQAIDQTKDSAQLEIPAIPAHDAVTGEPFELSQTFKDTPDLKPCRIEIMYNEASDVA